MVNVLRRFSKPIMLVITILVVVTFSFWSPNAMTKMGSGTFSYLYGKPVSVEQMMRQRRKVQIYACHRGPLSRRHPRGRAQ
jgi:hypothetical protein